MVRTIKQCRFNTNYWVASQNAILHTFLNTFVNRAEEFFSYNITYNFFNEFVIFFRFRIHRFSTYVYVTEITFTTCLTYEFTFLLNRLFDRFTVRNHWLTNVRFYTEFTLHTVNNDVKVKLTHTSNNRLTRFFVCTNAE